MIYKLICLMIETLDRIHGDSGSKEFKTDLQQAIKALKKVKKYF